MKRYFITLLSISVMGLFFTGCSTKRILTPDESFVCGRYEEAYDSYTNDPDAKNIEDGDFVLKNNFIISAAMMCGDYDTVLKSGQAAVKVAKSNLGDTEGKASMAVRESVRIFKGEPHEKCTSAFYAGFAAYYKKDYETAIIFLKNSLLFDQASEEGSRNDFAAAHYLLAKCYQKLGMTDEYQISSDNVAKTNPEAAKMLKNNQESNALVFVELGTIGHKRPDNVVGMYDKFYPSFSIEDHCKLFVDDIEIGKTADLLDLDHQAMTRDTTSGKAASQTGKGVLKMAAGAIPIFGGLAKKAIHETIAAQDFRQWYLLPKKIAVFEGYIEPGIHNLSIKFFDSSSRELRRFEQVLYYIAIDEGKETVLYLRGTENSQNTYVVTNSNEKKFDGNLDIPFRCQSIAADPESSFDKIMLPIVQVWNPYTDKEEYFRDRD